MSTETTGGQGQAPATGTPQQGQAPAATQDQQGTDPGQAPGAGTPGSAQFDPSTIQDPAAREYLTRMDHELREARQEAARYRTERGTLQEQVQQYRQQNETAEQAAAREAEERQQRLTALEAENRDLKVAGVIRDAAQEARAYDPSTIRALIDGQIVMDENGQPSNVVALIQALKVDKPFLFKRDPAGADAGAGAGSGASPSGVVDMNAYIRGRANQTQAR